MSKPIYHWFSNMERLDTPLVYEGIEYHTIENFYRAMKTKSRLERRRIARMSPSQAKRYKDYILRDKWDELKEHAMRFALYQKFTLTTSWGGALVASGETEIINSNNEHDNYWGICICQRCQDNMKGQNVLGKMLMERRKHLKSMEEAVSKEAEK